MRLSALAKAREPRKWAAWLPNLPASITQILWTGLHSSTNSLASGYVVQTTTVLTHTGTVQNVAILVPLIRDCSSLSLPTGH